MAATDPKLLQIWPLDRLEIYAQVHRDELALFEAEIRRRKDEKYLADLEKNPLKPGDHVKTAWDVRNKLPAKKVVGLNPKSVLVESRFYNFGGERIALARIVEAWRNGEPVDLSSIR